MADAHLDDLAALVAVADERSFTRAARRLGVSQSALSQTIRGLEARLGIRLLNRITRSVSPTPAGERLLDTVRPRIEEISKALAAASELRHKPAGLVRLTATENAAEAVLWPAIRKLLPEYPDIEIEVVIDNGLTDIVAEQVDAGVRFGETVAKDMILVRIGPPMRMAVVGLLDYLTRRPAPRTPRDLTEHECISLRLPGKRGMYAREFERSGRELNFRVDGRLVFNTASMMLKAALEGFGLAYFTEQQVAEHIDRGTLIRVLRAGVRPLRAITFTIPAAGNLLQLLRCLLTRSAIGRFSI